MERRMRARTRARVWVRVWVRVGTLKRLLLDVAAAARDCQCMHGPVTHDFERLEAGTDHLRTSSSTVPLHCIVLLIVRGSLHGPPNATTQPCELGRNRPVSFRRSDHESGVWADREDGQVADHRQREQASVARPDIVQRHRSCRRSNGLWCRCRGNRGQDDRACRCG